MTGDEDSPSAPLVRVAPTRPDGALRCRALFDDLEPADGRALDEEARRLVVLAGFEGAAEESCLAPGADGIELLVGLGRRHELTLADAETLVTTAVRRVRRVGAVIAVEAGWLAEAGDAAAVASAIASAAGPAGYDYRASASAGAPPEIVLVGADPELAEGVRRGLVIGEAINLVRDLVNEPAATMTPSRVVEHARRVAQSAGLDIRVWDQTQIAAENLGGLAAVARGSREPAYLVRLEYPGLAGSSAPTVALVGKGVTFDSGGLSLKSADAMVTMKIDMCGAATVLGAMSALRDLGVAGPVRAYLPLSENMPGGAATKPGDVAVMRNGLSVEVINTDAEGRLLLADALAVAVDEGADRLVDIASLTGACRVALGTKMAGVMGNDRDWTDRVLSAAQLAREPMWPLPLVDAYKTQLATDVADLRNVGRPVRPNEAGAIVAALFLRDFVGDTPWAHIDMGGPAYHDVETATLARGATGFGVRTLLGLVSGDRQPDGKVG